MRKQLIRTSKSKDLFIVYDNKQCFYIVSTGDIEIKKGEVTSENVLYSSKHLQDCLNYFENGGTK